MSINTFANNNTSTLKNTPSLIMDTSNWITHPIGRFLIKLPPSTRITWYTTFYNNDFNLIWKDDFDIEKANNSLKNEYELLKEGKMKFKDKDYNKAKFEYIENFGIDGLGSLLISYFQEYTIYKMYVVNNKSLTNPNLKQRVYWYEHIIYSQENIGKNLKIKNLDKEYELYKKANLDFIHNVANNIYLSDETFPIRIESGVYFTGGFLPIPDALCLFIEESKLYLGFHEYPNTRLEMTFSHMNLNSKTMLLDENTQEELAEKKKDALNIAPEGQLMSTIHEGIKKYYFEYYNPQSYEFEKPGFNILFRNKDTKYYIDENQNRVFVPPLTEPSFPSDEEAIAFWNAIKENIRFRPDGVHVPLPEEAQGKPYFIVNDKIVPIKDTE